MIHALAFALALGRSVPLVFLVASEAQIVGVDPILAVAVVEVESQYTINAYREEWNGTNSFGLMQLNSRFHPQFRDDVPRHVAYGVRYLRDCIAREGNWEAALSYYNSGYPRSPVGLRYAAKVLGVYKSITERSGN